VISPPIREIYDTSYEPAVRGFLHFPATSAGRGLVLTHGAGGNAQSSLLVALAESFCNAGFAVLRLDLPFRQGHSWRPPGPGDAARDRAGLKNTVRFMGAQGFEQICLGGHSYGGRQSSMLCAEEPELVSTLLLFSYPLHPPRKPEQLRTQHLPDLRTPSIFVHGTRDPFGTVEELELALKMIPAKTRLLAIDGAGHDLGFKGKAKKETLPKLVLDEFQGFLS